MWFGNFKTAPAARPLLVAGALSAALLLGSCGGGGGGGSGPTPEPPVAPPREEALAASQPGELLGYVKDKLRQRQTQRKATPEAVFVTGVFGETAVNLPGAAMPATTTAAATAADRSGTVVQEQGVDEDDTLKTDGSIVYALRRASEGQVGKPAGQLLLHRRAADGSLVAAGKLDVITDPEAPGMTQGMLLASAAQRVAALGITQTYYTIDICPPGTPCPASLVALPFPQRVKNQVLVDIADVADPQAPRLASALRIDGRLVGSRLVGNTLVLVTQHSPELAVEALPLDTPDADREAVIAKLTAADLLPTIRTGSAAPLPLVVDTDCYVQPKNASLGIEITTITTVDLASPTLRRTSRCFAGGVEAMYMAPTSLYLTTTRNFYAPAANVRFAPHMSSDVHKFTISGQAIEYRGSGEVEGHLGWDAQRRSYRMGEWNGDLRVLTFTGDTGWAVPFGADTSQLPPASPAKLTILRERTSDRSLQAVATLPNATRPAPLGKAGEQVYAVRFLGARGYLVTFRRTDPLYVLDLATPSDPRIAGELEMSGFSDYLFPIGDALLLGVGKDADARGVVGGVKVALLDVGQASQPKLLASALFGSAGSWSALDASRHGIDLFTRGSLTRVALPVSVAQPGQRIEPLQALQKLEVDAAARTLRTLAPLALPAGLTWGLEVVRSVQIGDKLYLFDGQRLTAHDW